MIVTLSGQLVCSSPEEEGIVRRHLEEHVGLTRAEPGCLRFDVVPTEDPMVWQVDELFVDQRSFADHQQRVAGSTWGRATRHIERRFTRGFLKREQSAVVVTLPDLDPVVGQARERLDPAARLGVRAHVTILYPFVAPDSLSAEALETLGEMAAATAPLQLVFRSTSWFSESVLWLAPGPDTGLRKLTSDVIARFPGHPPYAGTISDPTPHLTVGSDAALQELRSEEDRILRKLPVSTTGTHLTLLVGDTEDGSWLVLKRFPFGGRKP